MSTPIRTTYLGRIENLQTVLDRQYERAVAGEEVLSPDGNIQTPDSIKNTQTHIYELTSNIVQYAAATAMAGVTTSMEQHIKEKGWADMELQKEVMERIQTMQELGNQCFENMQELNSIHAGYMGYDLMSRDKEPHVFSIQLSTQYAEYFDNMMKALTYALEHNKEPQIIGKENHWDLTEKATQDANRVVDTLRQMRQEDLEKTFGSKVPEIKKPKDADIVVVKEYPPNVQTRDVRLWVDVLNDQTGKHMQHQINAAFAPRKEGEERPKMYVVKTEWDKIWSKGTPIVHGNIEDRTIKGGGPGPEQITTTNHVARIMHAYGYYATRPDNVRQEAIRSVLQNGVLAKNQVCAYLRFIRDMGKKPQYIRDRHDQDLKFAKDLSVGRETKFQANNLTIGQ